MGERRRHTIEGVGALPLVSRFISVSVQQENFADSINPKIIHSLWRVGAAVCATWSDDGTVAYEEIVSANRERVLAWISDRGRRRDDSWLWACGALEWAQLSGWLHALTRDDCRVRKAIIGDPPTALWMRIGGRGFVLIDTRNYLECTEEELSLFCGLRMPQEPLVGGTIADASERARAGAWSVHYFAAALRSMADRASLGSLSATLGSSAWRWYRYAFMNKTIEVHCCGEALAAERDSYHGGDVGVYHVGRAPEKAYHLDVNSLYPSVMADSLFPARLDRVYETATVDDAADAIERRCVIARVEIDDGCNPYPARAGGRRIDCTGRYWTSLAGPELADALANGSVSRVGMMATYRGRNLFGEWSEFWWELRLRCVDGGDALLGKLCKRVANALSGRWAMRTPEWEDAPGVRPAVDLGEWWEVDVKTGRRTLYLSVGGKVLRRQCRSEGADSCPAVASYITSAGRVRMRQLRSVAGSSEVYYQDTDSLFVSALGLSRLRSAKEVGQRSIGKLRVIGGPADLVITAPRVYNYSGVQTVAGISGDTADLDGSIWRHSVGESGRGIIRHSADMTTHTVSQTFRSRLSAGSRVIGPDGWTEAPNVGG